MTDPDVALRRAVKRAERAARNTAAPPFETVWAAAGARAASIRRRRYLLAGCAAAVLVIALSLRMPMQDEWLYIDETELLETTGWSAPSDSLLPAREFDIYRDIPVLIESTENHEGALL